MTFAINLPELRYTPNFSWSGSGSTTSSPSSTSTTSTSTTTSSGTSVADSSAKAIIDGALSQYGLSSLSSWAWQKWQAGESVDQIMLELRSTPEYKTRFPAMETLSQSGHAISEAEYINLEQTYIQLGRQYGLPSGFYDQPSDFTALIAGEVSPVEYQQRLQDYQAVAYDVDPTIRDELKRLYGIDAGHLAAYFIDPAKALPVLQRTFVATQAASAAERSGFGELSLSQAESLSGVDASQFAEGFGNLLHNQQLFQALPGEAGQAISTEGQLGAQFLGDAATQQQIEGVAAKRKAVFSDGGGFSQSQTGYAGVG